MNMGLQKFIEIASFLAMTIVFSRVAFRTVIRHCEERSNLSEYTYYIAKLYNIRIIGEYMSFHSIFKI